MQTSRRLDEYPAYETLSAVEVLYIEDVTTDPFLTDTERERLTEGGIGAMLVIPLVVTQRLSGVIGFTHPAPVTVSPLMVRALRNLGDQIAVVFENQSLLRSTATTLDEVQTLYDINRAMLSAREPSDILQALRQYLAQDSSASFYAAVERSAEDSPGSFVVRYRSLPDEEQTIDRVLNGTPDDLFGKVENTNILFIEDIQQTPPNLKLYEALTTEPAHAYILIVVCEFGRIEEFIAVAYAQPQVFDSRTRRLFNAVADQIGVVLQNQRLLRSAQDSTSQLTQQVRVLQGLNRLSAGIVGFQTEKDLLDYAAESMVTALQVDHCGIVLFEQGDVQGTVVSEYPAHQAVGSKVENRTSAMMDRLREKPDQAVVIRDIGTDPLIELETRGTLRRIGVEALMVLALYVGGEVIGTVGLDLYDHRFRFSPEVIETAQTMVSQIAIGLQNIRLLLDAQRRAEQLQRVTALGQSVQGTLSLSSILNLMLTESSQMLTMDSMGVAFYDPRQAQLRLVGQYGGGETTIELESEVFLTMSGTFVGQVWETGEMLAYGDSHLVTGISRMQDLSMRSVMVAPIRARGRLTGTVSVGCFRPYSYTETDRAIFLQMVNQLAVAIENAEAYRQSQRVAQNEALVNEISTHFQQHSEVDDMLRIAITELGEALGARKGRIRMNIGGGTAS